MRRPTTTTALDRLSQIGTELDEAELGLSAALATVKRISAMIEAMDKDLRPVDDKRWLLYPLDLEWPITGRFLDWCDVGGMRWQHEGVDFACPANVGVLACASGVVTFAGIMRGYGNFIRIEHQHNGRAWHTGYAHLSHFDCHVGGTIIAKQRIGLSGESGNVTGPHLHLTAWGPDSTFKPAGCTEYLRGVINPLELLQMPTGAPTWYAWR